MMRHWNTNQVTRVSVVYGPLYDFHSIVSLYHATLKVSSILNEGRQCAIESLVRIHLLKEHRAKKLYLLNKMSCEIDAGVKKGRWKIYLQEA
jgi:hypothetical protein